MRFTGIRLVEQTEQNFVAFETVLNQNKTGTYKVGAISKAQKAQFSKYA